MRIFYFLLLLNVYSVVLAQHQSPDQFLGNKLGSKFAYHHEIVSYFEHVAKQNSAQMKLISYGRTNEGRPLLVAVMTSPENFAQLEKIRIDHLKSIHLLDGESTKPSLPITWLSYNIHGNEAASSHTSMKVLDVLLDKSNETSRAILANSIVILDPCLNPDGYSRYTEWYNRYQNKVPDVTPYALEHDEPWPSGRFNHYLFDLNRDWAWQVQSETQQRVALYKQWMPHLHADFHEMGYERSYFFPPAAKPFHQDITSWQREFGAIVGAKCREYFDKNNWSYFTREDYDLFYPSYGDTWPTFNGAIGITYEQGGSGKAGLGIWRESPNDTLTLESRIEYHFATSMATLESVVLNKKKIVNEYVKFHQDALERPTGKYKSYVVKTAGEEAKIKYFTDWLNKQGFQYGVAGKKINLKATQLTENIEKQIDVQPEDIIISTYQPKSNLIRVLFEVKPVLEDSLTYDLTSWSVAYLYGLDMYGVGEKLNPKTYKIAQVENRLPEKMPYAYVVNWNGFNGVAFLSALLKSKIVVKSTNEPFEINGEKFTAGSLIIPHKGNTRLDVNKEIVDLANQFGVVLKMVNTGFVTTGMDFGSDMVQIIKPPKVVAVAGEGVVPYALGEVWHYFEKQIQYPLTLVNSNKLSNIPWHDIDILILPNGQYQNIFNDRLFIQLREWVEKGGKIIAMESATNKFLNKIGFGLLKKSQDTDTRQNKLRQYGNRGRDVLNQATPGSMYRVELDRTHPLAFGCGPNYYTLVSHSYQIDFLKSGWNVGHFGSDAYRAGFVGKNIKSQLNNTLIIGVEEIGSGEVVYLMDNPLFRNILADGMLLFGNAVFR